MPYLCNEAKAKLIQHISLDLGLSPCNSREFVIIYNAYGANPTHYSLRLPCLATLLCRSCRRQLEGSSTKFLSLPTPRRSDPRDCTPHPPLPPSSEERVAPLSWYESPLIRSTRLRPISTVSPAMPSHCGAHTYIDGEIRCTFAGQKKPLALEARARHIGLPLHYYIYPSRHECK